MLSGLLQQVLGGGAPTAETNAPGKGAQNAASQKTAAPANTTGTTNDHDPAAVAMAKVADPAVTPPANPAQTANQPVPQQAAPAATTTAQATTSSAPAANPSEAESLLKSTLNSTAQQLGNLVKALAKLNPANAKEAQSVIAKALQGAG